MVLVAVVLAAALYDVRYRRIPNWITMAGVLTGLALNTFVAWDGAVNHGWAGLIFSLKGLCLAFGVYFALYLLHAMGAGDVKMMAAIGSLVGWENWFAIFVVTAITGGIAAMLLVAFRGRTRKTLWNVGFILSEMKRGRPAYLGKEELDVRSPKAVGLPHGAVIAVGTVFFLALSYKMGG